MCDKTLCPCIIKGTRTLTHMEDYKRKKGKDKKKETFKKYGKNTPRGLRHKLEQQTKNDPLQNRKVV